MATTTAGILFSLKGRLWRFLSWRSRSARCGYRSSLLRLLLGKQRERSRSGSFFLYYFGLRGSPLLTGSWSSRFGWKPF